MKKQTLTLIVTAGILMAKGAFAGLTETTDLGDNSSFVTYGSWVNENLLYSLLGWQGSDAGWDGLANKMAELESTPTVNGYTQGVYTTSANALRYPWPPDEYGYAWNKYGHCRYSRAINFVTVTIPASSNYVGATLEWSVTLDNRTVSNRTSVAPGGSSLQEIVLWPDYLPRGAAYYESYDYQTTRAYSASKPRLKVTRQVAEAQPQTNTDVLARHGDPIDSINGNVTIRETDISIPTPGIPLEFHRWYGTTLDGDGSLGSRSSHTYLWRIGETNTVFNGVTNTWLVLRAGGGLALEGIVGRQRWP